MKKILPLIILILYQHVLTAQITVAAVKANFGVEADLSANYYNNLPTAAVDDWFNNGYAGTGKGVIDTTGAALLVSRYTTVPASKKLAFSRPMAFPAYSIVNNRMLLDAVFYRDFHGNDSTAFGVGSNKNGVSPGSWTSPAATPIPDKNDILEAMIHVRRAGPNVTDSLWLFSAISLENVTGNRFFDFELYQSDISFNKSTRTFTGFGPDAGHTQWQFDGFGNIRKPGDIIFTAEFSSASLTLVEARIWVHRSMLLITPTTFNWGGSFDGDGASANFGYANILPKTGGSFYTGLQSAVAATWAGPFKVVRDDETVVDNYIAKQFMEFSVNLTKLGIEPANYSSNPCGAAFIRVMVKTRSSTSFTAELKDFIAPFKVFDYPTVNAHTDIVYYCGSMPNVTLNVLNPNATSVYTWTTNNGNIVGSNIGSSITVNAPGTYYVSQQMNAACAISSVDSLTIIYSTFCVVLDVSIKGLTAIKNGTDNQLNWDVNNNQEAEKYIIEYSTNNLNFKELESVPTNHLNGLVRYEYKHASNLINSAVIYYRVRVVGKNETNKLSEIAAFRNNSAGNINAAVFPNPTKGELWFSIKADKNEIADVSIMDSYGKIIITTKLVLHSGENHLPLPSLSGKAQGTYLVKVKTSKGIITQKIILKQ